MTSWNFTTPEHLDLDARIPAGTVEIDATDTLQTHVDITGAKNEDDLRVELEPIPSGGHRLVIDLDQRGHKVFGWLTDREFRVRVTVPEGSDLHVATGSADLACTGSFGSVEFKSGSGDVAFHEVTGDLNVKVASGDLQGRRVGGDVRFTSASGDAQVGTVAGSLNGKTASGDVQIGMVGGAVQVTGASGDVEIGSVSRGDVTIRSVSGDIEIGVARGTRVWLDLGSTSGETTSELDAVQGETHGPTVELHVTTVSGDIRVRRARDEGRIEA